MAAKRSSSRASSRTQRASARKKKAPVKAPVKKSTAKAGKKAGKKPPKKASPKKRRAAPPKSRGESQVEQIQRVIDVMVAAGAVEVELEEAGSKLRVRLKEEQPVMTVAAAPEPRAHAVAAHHEAPRAAAPSHDGGAPHAADAPPAGEVFASPMVGTFYRSPSPDAEPFVKEGDMVTADSVLCIIEAMKVMNEIKAEMDGQVVECTAQNGEPVEYGQPLFTIKT